MDKFIKYIHLKSVNKTILHYWITFTVKKNNLNVNKFMCRSSTTPKAPFFSSLVCS